MESGREKSMAEGKRMVKRLGRRVLLPVAFWLAVWELCYLSLIHI